MTDETHPADSVPGAHAPEPPSQSAAQQAPQPTAAQSFDAWLSAQDDAARRLVESHITGLKGALDSERTERKSLAKQIRELSARADEGSDLRKRLDALTGDLESASRKAAFYESAPADAANLRLAWLAAQDGGLVASDGKVDWNRLRTHHPELFRRAVPTGNAGSGAQQEGQGGGSMNAFIRAAAGKR